MKKLIEQLVLKKGEDIWWDFKQEHHSNLVDLLHDILCMANVLYKGDRYIIFGVSNDYKIVGLTEKSLRRTQADILDFLRKKSFANHNIPKIKIDTVHIEGNELDVLTIKNEREKPYYVTKDEKKGKETVRLGVVYSRYGDTNTPKDSCANPHDIEAMWRERFGLDQKASDRFINILLDFNNWKYDGTSKAFYDIDPEYTIEIGGEESSGGKFWWEEDLFEKPDKYFYHLKHKRVELHKIPVVRFRSENLCIPFPNIEFVTYPEKDDGCETDCYCDLFYYLENSIEHNLFKHIRAIEVNSPTSKSFTTPIETQMKPPIITLPFLILDSENSLKVVCEKLVSNFDNYLKIKEESDIISSIQDKEKKRYAAEKLFSEWAFRLEH